MQNILNNFALSVLVYFIYTTSNWYPNNSEKAMRSSLNFTADIEHINKNYGFLTISEEIEYNKFA